MNKAEFVSAIAARTNSTKKDAAAFLDATTQLIIESVSRGDKVSLSGFGTFEAKQRQARECTNPQTKKK